MIEDNEYFPVLELVEHNNNVNYTLSMDEYKNVMLNDKNFIIDTISSVIYNLDNSCITYTNHKGDYTLFTIMFNHNGLVKVNTSNIAYSNATRMISFLESFLQLI